MATLRVTNLKGRSANVAPDLPDGANITGVCTATSFVGSGAALTGIDATSIKDSGDTVRVQANTSGIVVTGVSTVNSSLISQVNAGECQIRTGYSATKYAQIGRASTGAYQFISQENGASLEFGTAESADGGGAAKFYIDRYGDVSVGTAATIKAGGSATFAGIVTANSFSGDGSALTGIEVGITTTYQYAQSGMITLNLTSGQAHEVTLAAGISTFTCTGGSVGDSHSLIVTQPSSGITTVGFSTYFLWPSGSAPNLSQASAGSQIDLVTFIVKQQTQTGTGVTQLLASAGQDYQ